MSDPNNFSKQYSRIGRYSRYAGLGFIALSVVLLVLSAYDQFIVFEIDSVAAFLVAVFLLFRDPRARVQTGVFEAILGSTDKAIEELSTLTTVSFTYVPTGPGVDGVVVVAEGPKKRLRANSTRVSAPPTRELTPPGRGLANLFVREAGIGELTMDKLGASLPNAMRERFSLASSTEVVSDGDNVSITLRGATATCTCATSGSEQSPSNSSIGCPVASFAAVLVCAATKRPVTLKPCTLDTGTGAWKISMSLGVGTPAPAPPSMPDALQVPVTVS